MGKRKWRRVRLTDLASQKVQKGVLEALDQVKAPQGTDSPEKRGPQSATTGQREGDPTLTPHQESTT